MALTLDIGQVAFIKEYGWKRNYTVNVTTAQCGHNHSHFFLSSPKMHVLQDIVKKLLLQHIWGSNSIYSFRIV